MTVTKKLIGRLPILLGEYDSTKTYSKRQRVTLYGSEFESKVDNNSIAPAILSNGTLTINTDNWRVVSNGTEAFLAGEKVKHFNEEDNPEFVSAKTDSDGKLIESTNVEGKKTFYGDVEVKGDFINETLKDEIEEYTDKKVDKVDGKTLIDKNVANILSTEDNAEYLDVKTDSENKIVSYRDTNGILHEQVGVSTNTIFLGKYKFSDISDFKKALINNDLSDKAFIKIKEPRFAIVNITGITVFPTAKGQNYHAYAEVWDLNGNYFKKKVILNPQGNSSMGFPKKNIAMDFCEDDWEGDDTTSIQIGDWVAQDSFHHKSYYCDIIRGIGAVSYKIYEQAAKTFGNMYDKPWKKALIDMSKVGAYTSSFNNPIEDDLDLQFDNGALCHPDGFPEAIYLNGEFYGIFSWQLKKHRDNYHFDKNNTNHIHLDGTISSTTIFNTSGNIVWGTGDNGFEIRNPKSLCYAEYVDGATGGYKYDADVFQGEIAGVDKNYVGTYSKSNTYTQNQLVDIEIDGKTHYFICSNADMANVNAPSLNNNTDKNPDFKGKTKTGWINATVSVDVKNNLIKMSKYMPELLRFEIVTTTNGDIRIGKYLRELTDLTTIKKGNYTKAGDKYYMAIHSSTQSSDVTDTSYWMDITANINTIRTKFETYFDTDNLALYQVISDVLENKDGVWKNWQWFTYDSVKWYVGIYDTDMTFGMAVAGDRITPLIDSYVGTDSGAPLGYFQKYYTDKLDALYKKLADNGIITVENIMKAVREWTMRIGTEYYKLEYKKWTNSPCNNASIVRTDYWKLLYNADGTPQTAGSETFDATKSYAIGDTVSFGANDVMGYYLFECVKATEALESNTPHAYSTYSPISKFNHYDNIYRIEKWVEEKLKITDKLYNYIRINN